MEKKIMINEQETLVMQLLSIRGKVHEAKDGQEILELVDTALSLAGPVQPHMMNADILGVDRILAGKNSVMEILRMDKDFVNIGWNIEDVKFQVVASLAMLMLKFVPGVRLSELNEQH